MFVAPVLAIGSWFLVDYLVAEKPHSAVSGNSYPLLVMSNCRYQSGRCTMKNGDIKLELVASDNGDGAMRYVLSSQMAISGAMITVSRPDEKPSPVTMVPVDASATGWRADLAVIDSADAVLRLAVNIDESIYYAETGTTFIEYQTTFPRDNFNR